MRLGWPDGLGQPVGSTDMDVGDGDIAEVEPGDAQRSPEHLITRRDALRVGAVGIGALGLAASGSLVGLVVPAGSSAGVDVGPQWNDPEYVTTVPLDGAWFASQLEVADFNGDGHQDILITRNSQDAQHSYPVTVLLGDGKGNFTDGTSSIFQGDVPQTQFARQIVIADFNGDGRPDVFIADTGDDHTGSGYQNTLILSAPGGKLVDATANLPQAYDYTHSAAAADVNGDGTIDIYVGNIWGANLVPPRILLNDGTGHFTIGTGLLPAAQTDLNQGQYTGSTLADVNGDGHPDLVLSAASTPPQSVVLLNDGIGHFTLLSNALPAKPFGPDAIGLDPTSFDINGDGHPDLLIGYTKNNPFFVGRWIQVLINNGDGTFSDQTASFLPQSDNSAAWPAFFRLADLQRTGHMDFGVVTSDFSADLYLRDQNDNFQPGPAIGMSAQAWAFIDATGDGSNDIIGVDGGTGDVYLAREIRATTTHPPPVLSHLKLTPAAFRAAHSGASVARHATGTTISYSVSEASTTTFKVERRATGGHRFIPLHGHFAHHAVLGSNHLHFTGRIGGKALPPGHYRLTATPKNASGHDGKTKQAAFTILS